MSRPLSDAEVSLLEKGLNFAVTPTNIPATEIVAKVESAIRTLDSEHADTIKRTVNNILQQDEAHKPNITKEIQEALKNLKQDDSIMILKDPLELSIMQRGRIRISWTTKILSHRDCLKDPKYIWFHRAMFGQFCLPVKYKEIYNIYST